MYITEENVLSVGVVDELGQEPDDPMYARQPIQLRWDPSNDEEVFVNVESVSFPACTRNWRVAAARICVNRTNVHLLDVPVHGILGFLSGDVLGFGAREVSFRRDALVNKYGDYRLHLAVTEKRPCKTEDRLINDELILEWPRRPKRAKVVMESNPTRGWSDEWERLHETRGTPNPLSDLFQQRYGDYVPNAERVRQQQDMLAQCDAAARAKRGLEERNRFLAAQQERVAARNGAPTGELFGVDAAKQFPDWMTSTAKPLTREQITRGLKELMGIPPSAAPDAARGMQEAGTWTEERGGMVYRKGDMEAWHPKVEPREQKKPERKIVVPVPRFWGQLDQVLNGSKKPEPSKEMPRPDPTPAGAEELIDWLRLHDDKPWAERLSIPRVTRFLKEASQYCRTWTEAELEQLAGS